MDKNYYQANRLPLKKKRELLLQSKAVCFEWWVDFLDCSGGNFHRQRFDMPFEQVMKKLNNSSHYTVIHRNVCGENHIEVCFNTMEKGKTWFLWLKVGMEHVAMFDHVPKYEPK